MKKLICLLLALCILLSCAATASAAESVWYEPSDAIVSFIANQEGFRAREHTAGGYCYIGYGTQVRSGTYPNGISREAAMKLLRDDISSYTYLVNSFLKRNGVSVTQSQFDALLSLTQNLSTTWMKTSYRLPTILLNGAERYSDVEIANAFGGWCHAGGRVLTGLAQRRMQEAKIFLYGDYGLFNYSFYYADADQTEVEEELGELDELEAESGDTGITDAEQLTRDEAELVEKIEEATEEAARQEPARGPSYPEGKAVSFTYVLFQTDAGEVEENIAYFVKGEPYGEFPSASRSGYALAGWKTEAGKYLKPSAVAGGAVRLSAAWTTGKVDRGNLSISPFTDVSIHAWYFDELLAMNRAGVIGGYASGAYRPGDAVSCGAALKLVLLAAGCEAQAAADGSVFGGYRRLALQNGWLDTGESTDLTAPASRLLVARLAARALGMTPSEKESPFADVSDGYATALRAAGIMTGSEQNGVTVLNAAARITRAQIAVVLYRMSQYAA